MKKRSKIFLSLLIVLTVAVSAVLLASCGKDKKKTIEVGVFAYKAADTYISSVTQALKAKFGTDTRFKITEYDGNGKQDEQTQQVETGLAKGIKLFLINAVDYKASGKTLAEIVQKGGGQVIFYNREVADDALAVNKDFSFVGTDPNKPGYYIGEMIADLIKNPEGFKKYDRNKNGKLDYFMLRAEPGNPEADGRTKYSVDEANRLLKKALNVTENPLNLLGEPQNAEWDGAKAQAMTATLLSSHQNDVDLIIANNDGMAIGVISALEAVGFNKKDSKTNDPSKFIPVYGVDAIAQAIDAIKNGQMSGTVKQDAVAMADAIFKIAVNLTDKKPIFEGLTVEKDKESNKVRVPYAKVA